MATKISDPLNKNLHIGDIFTPLKWGKFASKKFSIFDKWMTGKNFW